MRYHRDMKTLGLLAPALGALLLCSCRGTVPNVDGNPEEGISSIVIGGRIVTSSGETASGKMWINFETDGGEQAQIYRLPVRPQQALLYQVEPGVYHIAPTRNLFGFAQPTLTVKALGRTFRVPFPRDLLRKSDIEVKPTKIVPLGILEAVVETPLPGRPATMRMRLDDSMEARRDLLQSLIHAMMDPNAPTSVRMSAISWTRALDQSLVDVLAEPQRAPLYKAAP